MGGGAVSAALSSPVDKGVSLWSRSTALLLSVTTLSTGNVVGRIWAGSVVPFIAAVLLILASAGLAYSARWAPRGRAPLHVWLAVCIVCAMLISIEPLSALASVAVLLLIVLAVLAPRRLVPLLLLPATALIISAVVVSAPGSSSDSDVLSMMQGATGAFIHGRDPYLPDWPVFALTPHGPIIERYHFSYGPSILVLAAPGRVLGDVRFAGALMWAAIIVAVMWVARRYSGAAVQRLLACLLVASPLAPTMISSGWADIYALAALTTWVSLRDHHRVIAVAALGLCFSAKPTLGAVLLVALLWWPAIRRDFIPGIGVALAVAVPFAVWDHRLAFWQSTVGVITNPVYYVNRPDALSLNAGWHAMTGVWASSAALLVIVLGLAVPILLTRPRDVSDIFALGAALTVVVVVTAPVAFLNYYFVAAVALFLAVAFEGFAGEVSQIQSFRPLRRLATFARRGADHTFVTDTRHADRWLCVARPAPQATVEMPSEKRRQGYESSARSARRRHEAIAVAIF